MEVRGIPGRGNTHAEALRGAGLNCGTAKKLVCLEWSWGWTEEKGGGKIKSDLKA